MNKPPRIFTVIAVVTVVVTALFCGGMYWKFNRIRETNTLISSSPDGRTRVLLVDRRTEFQIDRNFDLRIEQPTGSPAKTIFQSPDEGLPRTERIIWSADGNSFILLGQDFNVVPEAKLSNGEQLYLKYDFTTGELKCNARQTDLPRFSIDETEVMSEQK